MRLLVYAATPLVAGAALWGWRALRGQAPKRYAVNAIIGILLLLYFATTAGLGLFWVARQELPVFDPHYLFGYMTIALVAAHVSVNAKQLLKYVRQQAPRILVSEGSGEWRFPVRLAGRLLLLAAFGGLCFYLGMSHASMTVITSEGPRAALPLTSGRAPAAGSGSTGALGAPPPTPAVDQLVTSGKATQSVAAYYHQQTIDSQDVAVDWSKRPDPFKEYPGARTVALPAEFALTNTSTAAAVDGARRPVVALAPKRVSLRELATILQMSDGLTGRARTRKGLAPTFTRAAPSAGALYPTLVYVVARDVEGLEPGIYHYDVKTPALQLVSAGAEDLEALARVSSSPQLLRGASFALVFTTQYYRTSFKYGARSYRFELLDAGHIAENALLAAEYEGLAARPLGRFDDRQVNALFGLDASKEAALMIVPFGERTADDASATGATRTEWPFSSSPAQLEAPDVPALITLVHGQTMLALAGSPGSVASPFPPEPPLAVRAGESSVALPKPAPPADDLFATIAKRRSARHWTAAGMTLEQLSTVLQASLGAGASGGLAPSVEEHRDLREYVVALRVRDLAPGVYAYDPAANALHLLKAGELKSQMYSAGLMQDCVGDADAVIVHTADAARLPYPDGSRGYRYASIDAGMAGERLYLSTVALGLGTTGIGSFEDDEVGSVIGVSGREELVLYLSAIGAVPEKDTDDD